MSKLCEYQALKHKFAAFFTSLSLIWLMFKRIVAIRCLFVALLLHFLSGALNQPMFVDWGQPPLLMNCLPSAPCCTLLLMFAESWQRNLKAACFVSFQVSCNREHKTETVRLLKPRWNMWDESDIFDDFLN